MEKRKKNNEIFKDAFNTYRGEKGKIQNYGMAEELFRSAAVRGVPFAPHYLIELLIKKYDKLQPTERTLDQIKECYFWLLIAMTHSKQHPHEDYYFGCYVGDASHIFSYKTTLEERLCAIQIQEIQDKAADWWSKNDSNNF